MEFVCSKKPKGAWWRLKAAIGVCCLAWGLAGCEQGFGPEDRINPGDNDPPDFLPPDGVAVGTSHSLGLLYFFDNSVFQLENPIPATDRRFVKRGRILLLKKDNQTLADLTRPDLADPRLAQIYAEPRLFGFESEPAGGNFGFREGQIVDEAYRFWPLDNSGGATSWTYNHDNFRWSRSDTVLGSEMSAIDMSDVWRVRWMCSARGDVADTHLPSTFTHDVVLRSDPMAGISLHGFTLTSERVEVLSPMVFRRPEEQRNPRFLWLSSGALGAQNSNINFPTTIDQCVDAMWGKILEVPVQFTGSSMQVGDKYTTWTYIEVDSTELGRRIRSTTREGIRCSGSGVVPQFPSTFFRLLTRFEIVCENVYDLWEERGCNSGVSAVCGSYGMRGDGVMDAVKFVATMHIGAPVDQVVQRIEIYLMRDVGPVVWRTGFTVDDRVRTRLRQAEVNGRVFSEADLGYLP